MISWEVNEDGNLRMFIEDPFEHMLLRMSYQNKFPEHWSWWKPEDVTIPDNLHKELIDCGSRISDWEYELLPDGLIIIDPEDVGALTSGLLVSDNAWSHPDIGLDHDCHPDEVNIWWDSEYQTKIWIETLLDNGEVIWQKGS